MVVRQQDHKFLALKSRKTDKNDYFPFGKNDFVEAEKRKLFALLVEDAFENQFLMSRILANRGIDVEIASNGQEAIEKALDAQHDFILMDMQMPVLDGYDATRILREMGYAKPIIALTALSMPEDHVRILASGCDAHLTKPINFQVLLQTIVEYTHADIEIEAGLSVSERHHS